MNSLLSGARGKPKSNSGFAFTKALDARGVGPGRARYPQHEHLHDSNLERNLRAESVSTTYLK